jgi:hypothetical protein
MAKKFINQPILFECIDSSQYKFNATRLILGGMPRDPQALSARLAKQFINQNRGILRNFDVNVNLDYDGSKTWLVFNTGIMAGAFPLLSPTSGKPEYGMIIKPRFEWAGVGEMIGEMGWRVVPTLLRLPLMPGTERKVPPWILSSIVLTRIQSLLNQMERRFELIHSIQQAPKGTINWESYATQYISKAQFMNIPCQYPDLRDDSLLKAAIHYTLRKQLSGLETQRGYSGVVSALIELCQTLIKKVSMVSPVRPSPNMIQNWFSGTFRFDVFKEGIQAIEWTIDEKGLAGIADLLGLPWILPMDQFFEAWVETLISNLGKLTGGIVSTGRKRETIVPIHWDKPYRGTQKYLLPDIIMEREDAVFIIDSKYKRHWEEFVSSSWIRIEDEIQENHRQDLMQVLAYSSLKTSKKVVACLVYPCQTYTWESLKRRNMLSQHAFVPVNGRNLEIILTAVPMNAKRKEVVDSIKESFSTIQ